MINWKNFYIDIIIRNYFISISKAWILLSISSFKIEKISLWASILFIFFNFSEWILSLIWTLPGINDLWLAGNEELSIIDIFVGSGGTMTSEAALRGIPTISYDGVPNLDEKYLVKNGLAGLTSPRSLVKICIQAEHTAAGNDVW